MNKGRAPQVRPRWLARRHPGSLRQRLPAVADNHGHSRWGPAAGRREHRRLVASALVMHLRTCACWSYSSPTQRAGRPQMRRQGPPSAPRISRNRFSRTCRMGGQGMLEFRIASANRCSAGGHLGYTAARKCTSCTNCHVPSSFCAQPTSGNTVVRWLSQSFSVGSSPAEPALGCVCLAGGRHLKTVALPHRTLRAHNNNLPPERQLAAHLAARAACPPSAPATECDT